MSTAIFYASSTGNTADAANIIAEQLGSIEIFDIAQTDLEKMMEYDNIIIGTPTWGDGDLADDFEDIWEQFCKLDFSSKKVALFGLGDQDGYGEYYLDAMGTIYEQVISKGATVISEFEVDDEYYHEQSKAQIGDRFVGLALDEDNQSELSEDRIAKWCSDIKEKI